MSMSWSTSASWPFLRPSHRRVDCVDELVEVDACEEGEVDAAAARGSPAEVDEVVPVDACADEPPLAAWLPVDVVVPVWAPRAARSRLAAGVCGRAGLCTRVARSSLSSAGCCRAGLSI